MTQNTSVAAGKRPTLSSEHFFTKHPDLATSLFGPPTPKAAGTLRRLMDGILDPGDWRPPSPFMTAVKQLEQTGFSRILEAAARENSPETVKETLEVLLVLMHVKIPPGVFAPKPAIPGRRKEKHTLSIFSHWIKMGRPDTTAEACAEIVRKVFPEFSSTPRASKKFKKRIALVRSAIKRH